MIQNQMVKDPRLDFTQSTSFWVPGVPAPGGSKTPGIASSGRQYVRPASKNSRPWMEIVRTEALVKYRLGCGLKPIEGPVKLEICFVMPRPLKHYIGSRKANGLCPDAPYYHTIAPDITKLIRSTEDALKGICWLDDSQVVRHGEGMEKVYGESPGAKITVSW